MNIVTGNSKDLVVQDLFALKAEIKPTYTLCIEAKGNSVLVTLFDEKPLITKNLNYETSSLDEFKRAYSEILNKTLTQKPRPLRDEQGRSPSLSVEYTTQQENYFNSNFAGCAL